MSCHLTIHCLPKLISSLIKRTKTNVCIQCLLRYPIYINFNKQNLFIEALVVLQNFPPILLTYEDPYLNESF